MLVYFRHQFIYFILICLCISCSTRNGHKSLTDDQIQTLKIDSANLIECNTHNLETITVDLSSQATPLSDVIDSISVIKLDDDEDAVIGDIRRIIMTDTHIIINDYYINASSIVIFDRKGNFIKRIPFGNGPGELNDLTMVCYDSVNKIIIAQLGFFLNKYSIDGEFLGSEDMLIRALDMECLNNEYVIINNTFQNHSLCGDSISSYVFTCNDKYRINNMMLKPDKYNFHNHWLKYTHLSDSSVVITKDFCDTIWEYSNNSISSKFLLDYSSQKLSINVDNQASLQQSIDNNEGYYYQGEYTETTRMTNFVLKNSNRIKEVSIYLDKKTRKTITCSHIFIDPNIIPYLSVPLSSYRDRFISYVSGMDENLLRLCSNSEIISDDDKQKIKTTTRESNPLIILYKIKIND